jgi:cytochrome P450
MCANFFYLSRYPEVYARLAAEIRGAFGSAQEIRAGPALSSCKYLRAVIDESLRSAPPSLTTLWRVQEPSAGQQPFVVDGHVVPAGTEVGVHTYSLLHDAAYFPDPFAYRPERWLEPEDPTTETAEDKERRAIMRRAQLNFGHADRVCPGKALAYLETSLLLAKTLWYFDFETAPGQEGELGAGKADCDGPWGAPGQYQVGDVFVATHDGPNLVFKPRGDAWRELEGQVVE